MALDRERERRILCESEMERGMREGGGYFEKRGIETTIGQKDDNSNHYCNRPASFVLKRFDKDYDGCSRDTKARMEEKGSPHVLHTRQRRDVVEVLLPALIKHVMRGGKRTEQTLSRSKS